MGQKFIAGYEINAFIKYPSSHFLISHQHPQSRILDYSIRYTRVHPPVGLSFYHRILTKDISRIDIGASISKIEYTSHSFLTWYGSLMDTIGVGLLSSYIGSVNIRYQAKLVQIGKWLNIGLSSNVALNAHLQVDEDFVPSPYYPYQNTSDIKQAFLDYRIGAFLGIRTPNGSSIIVLTQLQISPPYHKIHKDYRTMIYNFYLSIGYRSFF